MGFASSIDAMRDTSDSKFDSIARQTRVDVDAENGYAELIAELFTKNRCIRATIYFATKCRVQRRGEFVASVWCRRCQKWRALCITSILRACANRAL